jgi:3-hydroxy-D-aspartate aldolase
VSEVEVAAALCDDLLLANEVVSAEKCARLAALARTVAVTVAIDSISGIDVLASAAAAAGVTIGVLVDVNVGQGRCGVAPGDEAVALARRAAASDRLTLRGVMGYEGHLQPLRDRTARSVREAMEDP